LSSACVFQTSTYKLERDKKYSTNVCERAALTLEIICWRGV